MLRGVLAEFFGEFNNLFYVDFVHAHGDVELFGFAEVVP